MTLTCLFPNKMSLDDPPTVSTVSVKLPPFWPSDPEVWFLQVEAQFSTRGITAQKTRFEYIVSSLSPQIATEVRDLLLKPPADRPYDVLKAELIKRTTTSKQQQLQQLISGEQLGDLKPTQLLRRMQRLLGEQPATADLASFLRELFLQRLPSNVRMVLACTDPATELSRLAEMADKVMEVSTPSINQLKTPSNDTHRRTPPPTPSLELKELKEEIAQLTTLVQSLSTTPPRHSPRSRNCSPSPAADTLCWYHQKFGDQAHRCRPPCSRSLNDQAQH